jgi:allantoinase
MHSRYPYVPITDRPDFAWPEGRRLAVYIGLNLETFRFGEGLGAELAPGGPQPDVLNYAWRDYGNRVGAFRMADLFDTLGLPLSVLVNSNLYDDCPGLIDRFRARGDEIVGHGRTNSKRQGILPEKEERALIEEATVRIEQAEGRRPEGWLGPWISQSPVTPDLLKEAGYSYLLDWCHDDQPVWFKTRSGLILSVPYPQELNDIPMIVGRKMDAAPFADMIIDNFEEMLDQSSDQPLVMGIALHPYLFGQPYRLKHLRRALEKIQALSDERVWWTTSGAIAEHFKTIVPPIL